jgi:AcrR family transcriptional regulator
MPRFVSPLGQENHRVRVARDRRERTRAQLLNAVLSVYAGDDVSGPAVIDDVIRAAGVSRGTFYRYFDSVEEAVAELGGKLADELAEAYDSALDGLPDPLDRMASAIQICLLRAEAEPRWGMFVAHISHRRGGDSPALQGMAINLAEGVASGAFRFDSVDAAVHLTAGAIIEGIRHLICAGNANGYVEQLAVMILRGLGAPESDVRRAVAAASRRLREKGEQLVAWSPLLFTALPAQNSSDYRQTS